MCCFCTAAIYNEIFLQNKVPDYTEVISKPMDLATMMSKIDLHQYETVQDFLDDIDLICRNALEYNPDTDVQGMRYLP